MTLTESTNAPLGSLAPHFTLPDPLTGKEVSLSDFAQSPVMVIFMCNHCPYVVHIVNGLVSAANDLAAQGVKTVAISANDSVAYPLDSPDNMAALARANNFSFPYLYDEAQAVARAYHAVCTPDLYLYDADHKLYYRGQFDASRPGGDIPVSGQDVRAAAAALLAKQPAPSNTSASVGCSIKWKAA